MRTPSIYDYRPEEIEVAKRIRRENRNTLICAIIGTPFLIAFAALAIICACVCP